MLRRRASGAASAVRDAEATKRRTYGEAAQRAGASFVPFAFDTFGFRGEGARVFLANLARDAAAAMVGSNPPIARTDAADIPLPHTPLHRSLVSALMTKWTRRIACCLQMQNAILIRERRAAAWALATSGARPNRGGSARRRVRHSWSHCGPPSGPSLLEVRKGTLRRLGGRRWAWGSTAVVHHKSRLRSQWS